VTDRTSAGPAIAPAPGLTVADVLRTHGAAFHDRHGASLTAVQRRALADLAACRTAALGGHLWRCGGCGHERVLYNSCRNRHCPTCQASARAAWLEREASWLLPVEYHHVVFTLPAEVAAVALANPAVVYGLLFRAASATLREVAADPKHLGAEVGVVAVLHTWGQNLHHHPHLHCLVTGGGLACDAAGRAADPPRWVACRPGFFLPVRVLSRVFRGKFLTLLAEAHGRGQLTLTGALAPLASAAGFAAWRKCGYSQDWVVYSQPPCAGAEVVLKYLARYVHRVALSNSRLVAVTEEEVAFRWKDYARGGQERVLTLSGEEFVRRFMQHVLPRGFVKARHYGLLASRGREEKLAVCRWQLLREDLRAQAAAAAGQGEEEFGGRRCCPECGSAVWAVVGPVGQAGGPAAVPDTS
jgi:putative transposase/transposase-like zinc-binding protein